MPIFFWDASSLTKRYVQETGDSTVNALFGMKSFSEMVFTVAGYSESYSILRRKTNAGILSVASCIALLTLLKAETIDSSDFQILSVSDRLVFAGLSLIDRHNLNSSDASILAAYLDYQRSLPAGSPICVLVASDRRLLRAAQAKVSRVSTRKLSPWTIFPNF